MDGIIFICAYMHFEVSVINHRLTVTDVIPTMFSNACVNRGEGGGAFLLTEGLFFVILQHYLAPCTWVVVRYDYCKKRMKPTC